MYPILKENGYLNFDIWTDPEVRRIIQDRLGCGIDQADVWRHPGENPSDRIKGFKKTFTSYKNPRIERFSLVGSYALPNW